MSITGTAVTTIITDEIGTTEAWASRIGATWQKSVEAIFETGRLIADAKTALPHGDFTTMIENDLPFGARTAQMLMQIARDQRLTDPAHVQHLPPSWGTLYELTKLDDEAFNRRLKDGAIRPDMQRRDAARSRRPDHAPDAVRVFLDCGIDVGAQPFGALRATAIRLLADAEALLMIHRAGQPVSTASRVDSFYPQKALAEIVSEARTLVRERHQ